MAWSLTDCIEIAVNWRTLNISNLRERDSERKDRYLLVNKYGNMKFKKNIFLETNYIYCMIN